MRRTRGIAGVERSHASSCQVPASVRGIRGQDFDLHLGTSGSWPEPSGWGQPTRPSGGRRMDRPSTRSSRRPGTRTAGFLRDSHHEKTLAVAVRTILIQRPCCRRLGHEPPRFFAAFDCSGRQLRRPIFFTLIIDPGLRRCPGRICEPSNYVRVKKVLAASIIDNYFRML